MRRAVEFGDGWDAPYADPERISSAVVRLGEPP
jgi:hypothetical protein